MEEQQPTGNIYIDYEMLSPEAFLDFYGPSIDDYLEEEEE